MPYRMAVFFFLCFLLSPSAHSVHEMNEWCEYSSFGVVCLRFNACVRAYVHTYVVLRLVWHTTMPEHSTEKFISFGGSEFNWISWFQMCPTSYKCYVWKNLSYAAVRCTTIGKMLEYRTIMYEQQKKENNTCSSRLSFLAGTLHFIYQTQEFLPLCHRLCAGISVLYFFLIRWLFAGVFLYSRFFFCFFFFRGLYIR